MLRIVICLIVVSPALALADPCPKIAGRYVGEKNNVLVVAQGVQDGKETLSISSPDRTFQSEQDFIVGTPRESAVGSLTMSCLGDAVVLTRTGERTIDPADGGGRSYPEDPENSPAIKAFVDDASNRRQALKYSTLGRFELSKAGATLKYSESQATVFENLATHDRKTFTSRRALELAEQR